MTAVYLKHNENASIRCCCLDGMIMTYLDLNMWMLESWRHSQDDLLSIYNPLGFDDLVSDAFSLEQCLLLSQPNALQGKVGVQVGTE